MQKPSFLNFLDVTYHNACIKNQQSFTFKGDAETKAVSFLMNTTRSLCKWWHIPAIIVKFWLTKAHILKAPEQIQANPQPIKPDLKAVPNETKDESPSA